MSAFGGSATNGAKTSKTIKPIPFEELHFEINFSFAPSGREVCVVFKQNTQSKHITQGLEEPVNVIQP